MTVVTTSEEPRVASRSDRRYRITLDRYNRMVAAGIFGKRDKVFLWKGELIAKMTKNPPHETALTQAIHLLIRIVPEGWHVRSQCPLELFDDSSPEPDLTIVRGGLADYSRQHPKARDAVLVVEVSDSSLAEDQGEVLESYASEGIPIYWIVNIPMHRVEVYADPSGPGERPSYRLAHLYAASDEVPVVIDGREVGRVAARDLLP